MWYKTKTREYKDIKRYNEYEEISEYGNIMQPYT